MRYLYLPVLTLLCLTASQLPAQQTTVRTPLGTSSSSFFEQNSVNWSGNWGGLLFQFGGGPATPTFGNFAPGAGLSTSFDVSRGNFNAKFNLGMSQGSRQSLTSQCPVVTLTDGQPGFVSDTSQTPFVMGEIPVVGGIPLAGFNPMAALGDMAPPPTQGNPAVQKMAQAVARGAQPPAKAGNPAPATPMSPGPALLPTVLRGRDLPGSWLPPRRVRPAGRRRVSPRPAASMPWTRRPRGAASAS